MKKLKFHSKADTRGDGGLGSDPVGISAVMIIIAAIIIIPVILGVWTNTPYPLIIWILAGGYYLWSKEYIKWE